MGAGIMWARAEDEPSHALIGFTSTRTFVSVPTQDDDDDDDRFRGLNFACLFSNMMKT